MEYNLNEVFEFIRNGANIKQFDTKLGYPITRIETIANCHIDIEKMGYANIEELGRFEEYLLRDGDILMSHINSEKHLGKSAIYENLSKDIIHGMNLLCLRPNKILGYPKYLNYFFNSNEFRRQLPRITKKSVNQASFSVTDLKKLKIYLPDIQIQQKVVEVLDKAQELINKRKEQIEALDELVKSKFIEMFGVPLANTKEWNEKIAGDVCLKITDGSHFSPKDSPNSNIPMLSVKDMMRDKFSYDTCKHVSKEDYEELKKNGCKPLLDDVLIAKDGSYFYYGFVLEKEIEQAVLSSIAILRPNKEIVNPHYIRYYMMSQEVVDLVGKKYVSGAALKRVILKGIRQIPVMVPPIELQNHFADFVKQVDEMKLKMEKSLKELEDNFNALMQKAFKGELL